VTVTAAPTAPDAGDKLVMLGADTTVKDTPLLAAPLTVTTTLPVVAPVGTVAMIDVALQLPIVDAVVPLNFTVLVPCVDPKLVPVIVTDAPTAPEVGERLVMLGAANEAPEKTAHTMRTATRCHLRIMVKRLSVTGLHTTRDRPGNTFNGNTLD